MEKYKTETVLKSAVKAYTMEKENGESFDSNYLAVWTEKKFEAMPIIKKYYFMFLQFHCYCVKTSKNTQYI